MEEDSEDISFKIQKLIIRTRLDLEPEFQEGRKKRSVLWGKVIAKIKEIKPDFDLTTEQISRKFINCHTTYRRIKNRHSLTGKNSTSWEFYDMFDEVYGTKYSIDLPQKNLQSSLYIVEEIADEGQDVNAYDSVSSFDNFSDPISHQKKKRRISDENTILEFFKKEAESDEEIHNEVMRLERCKIEMEDEKIKEMEDLEDFSFNVQKLIIRTRLDLEPEFQEGKKKKSYLWGKVIAKIKEIKPDFDLTREQINRKFLNFHTTYRRIKNRHSLTGKNATSWEFYDMFDEVYGTKYPVDPPQNNLQSSLCTVKDVADEGQDANAYDSISSFDVVSDAPSCQKKKRRMCDENNLLEFLRKEADRDEERHKEVMELERQKIEIEYEKINALIELKNVLQKMLEK